LRRLGPHSCVTCVSLSTGWAIYKVKSSQVNIASCNGRVNVSESAKTSSYMYFEAGKPVVNSEFNEGGSPKL
jgi:uncharacterized Fe-S center protein